MNKKDLSAEIIRISGGSPEKCMRCGKCTGACPAFDDMEVHPHQFATMIREGRVEELAAKKGLYNCMSCFACSERCPRSVEPARLIEAVRVYALRQSGGNHLAADDVPGLLDEALPQQAITSALRKYAK